MGCTCAQLNDRVVQQAIIAYGEALGLAYQIQDDILDVVSLEGDLGKPQGHDASLHKMTYPAVVGLEEAYAMRDGLYEQGLAALEPISLDTSRLSTLFAFVVQRSS